MKFSDFMKRTFRRRGYRKTEAEEEDEEEARGEGAPPAPNGGRRPRLGLVKLRLTIHSFVDEDARFAFAAVHSSSDPLPSSAYSCAGPLPSSLDAGIPSTIPASTQPLSRLYATDSPLRRPLRDESL